MSFKYSSDNKRYHTLSFYNKRKYGQNVYKACVNANLTCPNVDGTKGVGGCIYCESGSTYFTHKNLSICEQINREIERINKNGKDNKFIVYYQSNTNTHTSCENIKNMLETALEFENVVGITFSTRTDCVDTQKLELLAEYNKRTEICLEFGLQSAHDDTLQFLNRKQTFLEFEKQFLEIKKYGLRTCIHIINGLPNETREQMIYTAKQVSRLHPDGIKIHMLHISKGTTLANMYKTHPFQLLSLEDYAKIVCEQLENLDGDIVVERITGDPDKSKLIAPIWTANKKATIATIDKLQAKLDSYQGKQKGTKNV